VTCHPYTEFNHSSGMLALYANNQMAPRAVIMLTPPPWPPRYFAPLRGPSHFAPRISRAPLCTVSAK
jgi:hypothetical protein